MNSTYTSATNKPDKLLTGFISVRAPELKYVYGSLHEQSSAAELTSKFGRPTKDGRRKTDHVEETLRFLHAIDLVESPTGDVLDTVEPINERHFDGLALEARVLYHCNQQDGRQAHFADVHRALMSEETRVLDAGRDTLRTIIKRETDYDLSWTDEKLDMWVTLCEQLGLVTETEDGLVLSPCRALMHDALLLAPADRGEEPGYDKGPVEDGGFRYALDWINDNLFTVYTDRSGTSRLHPAIADVLRNMEGDGVVSLSAPGDSQNKVELPAPDLNEDRRGNRRSVTQFTIQSSPSETAYEYPLTQFITHQ